MSMIRYYVESLVAVIKHVNMEKLSYFCSVPFKPQRSLFLKCWLLGKTDTNDYEERRHLSNQKKVTPYKVFPTLLADDITC